MADCQCSLAIRLTGDGCRHCQPQTYIDTLEMSAEGNLEDIERLETLLAAEVVKVATLRHAIRNYLNWPFRSSEEALKQALADTDKDKSHA